MATQKKSSSKAKGFKRSGKVALNVAKDVGESVISSIEAALPGTKSSNSASRRAKTSMTRARKRLAGAIGGRSTGLSRSKKKSPSSRRKALIGSKSKQSKGSRSRKHG